MEDESKAKIDALHVETPVMIFGTTWSPENHSNTPQILYGINL